MPPPPPPPASEGDGDDPPTSDEVGDPYMRTVRLILALAWGEN